MKNNIVKINDREVGEGRDVFIIAEIGINHNGDVKTAKKLIDMAKWAGASAVKLQTYITEKRVAKDSPIYSILKECELSFSQQKELFNYARDKNIEFFSTPFDDESVDFLASLDVGCYKIASFDIVNKKLLQKVCAKGKPVIISRGMANQQEIDDAADIAKNAGVGVIILHCISSYPVPSHKDLNLETIKALKYRYNCPVGFSDHTLGVETAKYAVAAGADAIEKHFTLSRKDKGPDHILSTEPTEMKDLISGVKIAKEMLGIAMWSSIPAEQNIKQYRRYS